MFGPEHVRLTFLSVAALSISLLDVDGEKKESSCVCAAAWRFIRRNKLKWKFASENLSVIYPLGSLMDLISTDYKNQALMFGPNLTIM